MLQRVYNQRALSRVLCGLVFVALCNGATVWAFCPHLRSASHNCLNQHSVSHNHDSSAIGSFEKSCSYCAMHSEPGTQPVSISLLPSNSSAQDTAATILIPAAYPVSISL